MTPLKIRKFQKAIVVSSILPKQNEKFPISALASKKWRFNHKNNLHFIVQ
jgi:hypothetical protein